MPFKKREEIEKYSIGKKDATFTIDIQINGLSLDYEVQCLTKLA